MFTGIIETCGEITSLQDNGSNKIFWISSPVSHELKIDQSVSHDGVCLTVEEIKNGTHRVTAIAETLSKSNLDLWQQGQLVNIERCMKLNGRLDGHIVQGHIDSVATCIDKKELNGSREFRFQISEEFSSLIIEKGSVALNGISLTVFGITKNQFSVAIIPYTYQHTNMKQVEKGMVVNIEFDVIGKYVARIINAMPRNNL